MERKDILVINLAGNESFNLATGCLICGESVPITYLELYNNIPKVCDKCKQAIMKMREKLKEGSRDEIYW